MKPVKLSEFEKIIGYDFKDKNYLFLALTHSSFANEAKVKKQSNERVEFLGDAVLEVTVSDYLYRQYPDYAEGKLTKLRSALVCEFTLAQCARAVELGKYIMLSKGEDLTGGRERDSILSDAFEAVIGAIYLDGGIDGAAKFIHEKLLTDVESKTLFYDAKTILQEIVQSEHNAKLVYDLIEESGPDHAKKFVYQVRIGDKKYATGEGRTKKAAEQMAAYETILLLKK